MALRFAILLVMLAGPAAGLETVATIAGHATVKDGDGILFGNVEIRLQGIAAPEQSQFPVGPDSTDNLARIIAGHDKIWCALDGSTANRRPVGVCFVDGRDVGEMQVRSGHARDCPHFSGGRYLAAEQDAIAHGLDLSRAYPLPGYCER